MHNNIKYFRDKIEELLVIMKKEMESNELSPKTAARFGALFFEAFSEEEWYVESTYRNSAKFLWNFYNLGVAFTNTNVRVTLLKEYLEEINKLDTRIIDATSIKDGHYSGESLGLHNFENDIKIIKREVNTILSDPKIKQKKELTNFYYKIQEYKEKINQELSGLQGKYGVELESTEAAYSKLVEELKRINTEYGALLNSYTVEDFTDSVDRLNNYTFNQIIKIIYEDFESKLNEG